MDFLTRLEMLLDRVVSIRSPLKPRSEGEEQEVLDEIDASKADVFRPGSGGEEVGYAVDGSLRMVSTPYFRLFIAAGVAYANDRVVEAPGTVDVKYIAIQSDDVETLKQLEDVAVVRYKIQGIDKWFTGDLHEDVVGRIVRELVETSLIKFTPKDETLLVDGPLYYGFRSLEELDKMRVEALWERRAVAVVKRLEKSKKLCRAREWLEQHGVSLSNCNDQVATVELGKIYARSVTDVVVFGPFIQRIKSKELLSLPDRYLWYVYSWGAQFRIEAFRADVAERTLPTLLRYRTSLWLPYHIAVVDKLAKEKSRRMFLYVCGKLRARGVSLTYDTLMECYAG
jgi:hypothetical protein